jgi:hypothetical protein
MTDDGWMDEWMMDEVVALFIGKKL